MARARIIAVDYYEFMKSLRKAADAGTRIEKSQADKWKDYVDTYKINEIAMHSWGRSKFGGSTPVIINSGGEADGYYVYSKDEEAALKWVWEGDDAPGPAAAAGDAPAAEPGQGDAASEGGAEASSES